jgi:F0F1-type ATP synthase, epsilon subunit (mitochondrial delta subunit)
MSTYLLKILTHNEKVYESEVVSATVTCKNGQMTILSKHAPMVALLEEGPIVIKTENETITGTAGRGVLHVDRNETAAMLHSFKWASEEAEEESAEENSEKSEVLL